MLKHLYTVDLCHITLSILFSLITFMFLPIFLFIYFLLLTFFDIAISNWRTDLANCYIILFCLIVNAVVFS